ncbi:MAG TPA: hypothetical protein VKU93_06485 [Terracidiphilus sp.]|nr:hypothetical protein [Terracidiphilus sp.]
MRTFSFFFMLMLVPGIVLSGAPSQARAQAADSGQAVTAMAGLPQAPEPQSPQQQQSNDRQHSQPDAPPAGAKIEAHKPPPQPKRILGMMPNYRAVSAGELPPPPTPRQAFKIATQNSFDYSSFIFVGITSLLAEGSNAHPQLGKGVPGFWAYSWRGFVDKTDGNYWVIWALPSVLHEDERYYARGEGGIMSRGIYAATRVLITPNYKGRNTFNASEILGRGVANAISLSYYPSQTQTAGAFAQKYGYAIGRDALTNTFREFWPDIDAHLIHRHR